MINWKKTPAAMTALGFVFAATTGCGKIVENAVEKASEAACNESQKNSGSNEECDIDISEDGVSAKVGDDEVSLNNDGAAIPAAFPSYLTLAGGNAVVATKTSGTYNVAYTTTDPNAVSALRAQAEEAGCTVTNDTTSGETSGGTGSIVELDCPDGQATVAGGVTGGQGGVNISFTPTDAAG